MGQRISAIVLVLGLCPWLCAADFDDAASAYRSKDYPAAFSEFLKLANAGDPRAQTVIAMMYKYGESVPADPAKAFDWYLKAAKAGYGPALFNVGQMYASGLGVTRDRKAAVDWLTRAARAGFKRANKALEQLGASEVTDGKKVNESIPWSRSWNFRLPNTVRRQDTNAGEASVSPGASYRVQLGAMTTRAGANRLWDALVARLPDLFADAEPLIELSENADRRVYRVQTGPFDDYKSAHAFCARLQRALDTGCLPLRQ